MSKLNSISPNYVSLFVQKSSGVFEDTGVRLYWHSHIDYTYRIIEARMLGTLSKKHYFFACTLRDDKSIFAHNIEYGVTPAYKRGADGRYHHAFGGKPPAALVDPSFDTVEERFLALQTACLDSADQVIVSYDPVAG